MSASGTPTLPTEFNDHFSAVAPAYRQFRPVYPPALFAFLARLRPAQALAWDAATGNGQAAMELAKRYERVIATDASERQIQQAEPRPNIEYRVATAEASGLPEQSVDLIVVAQALHWFDFDRFYAEVRRVGRPGFVIAVIGYGSHRVNTAVDTVLDRFESLVDPYWPPERAHLAAGYRTTPFPFRELPTPEFALSMSWTCEEHLGYLRTWSAIQPFLTHRGYDPVRALAGDFAAAWGDPTTPRVVTWKLHLRVGT